MAIISPACPMRLQAVKKVPAREVPIELYVHRTYEVHSLETRIEVTGSVVDGTRTQFAGRQVRIDAETWDEDGIVDLIGLMAKHVARRLGAELK